MSRNLKEVRKKKTYGYLGEKYIYRRKRKHKVFKACISGLAADTGSFNLQMT